MNSIFFHCSEVDTSGKIHLSGSRVASILARNPWVVSAQQKLVKATVEGVGRGTVLLSEVTHDRLVAHFLPIGILLDRVPLILSVAIPRPQTIKKLIQLAGTIGLKELRFIKSELGDKSYWKSKQLRPEVVEQEIIKALEQSWDSEPLKWAIYDSLNSLFNIGDPDYTLCADTDLVHSSGCCDYQQRLPDEVGVVQVLVGPEAGWSSHERDYLTAVGVTRISLGPRILRVETAASLIVGSLLKNWKRSTYVTENN